jgi:hypothetical protein
MNPPSWLAWLTYRRVGMITAGAAIVGLGVFALRQNPARSIFGRGQRRLSGRPDDWYKHDRGAQPEQACYRTKTAALQAFKDYNRDQIAEWGPIDRKDSPEEYDAINHKRTLRGKRAVRTLARAMWEAMPSKPPFCLDRIDVELLNATSPGQAGSGFRIPTWGEEEAYSSKQEAHYRQKREDEAEAEVPFVVPPQLHELFARGVLVRRGVNVVWSKTGRIMAHVKEVAQLMPGSDAPF